MKILPTLAAKARSFIQKAETKVSTSLPSLTTPPKNPLLSSLPGNYPLSSKPAFLSSFPSDLRSIAALISIPSAPDTPAESIAQTMKPLSKAMEETIVTMLKRIQ